MKDGYARVSPAGRSESVDAQARQLTKAGCRKVFRDVHVSGAKTDRAQLRRVIETLEPHHRQEGRFQIPRRRMGRHDDHTGG